jgi:predicted nucleic acid-binding protein
MAFVLDASVAACWAFPDEGHPAAGLAMARIRTEEAVVPSLWWFEIRNILVVNERRKRIDESGSTAFLRELSRLPVKVDLEPNEAGVLRIARTYHLSVYDASYLELAARTGFPLATLDKALASAALEELVTLVGEP